MALPCSCTRNVDEAYHLTRLDSSTPPRPLQRLGLLIAASACLFSTGCSGPAKPIVGPSTTKQPTVAGPLRVLVVDDPDLADILQREWSARSDSEVEFSQATSHDTLGKFASEQSRRLQTDVVVFPSCMLGELAERKLIRQLPESLVAEPGFDRLEIFDLLRSREMQWDSKPYAVPFGSASLMLLVRTDLVPESEIPRTWQELRQRVDALKDSDTLAQEMVPLLQPLSAGWAGRTLLARTAAYAYDDIRFSTVFDYRTFKPRINSLPFTRALDELSADVQAATQSDQLLTPQQVLRQFLEGKSAMAITWPSTTHSSEGPTSKLDFPVAIFELPGSSERFDFASQEWMPRDGAEPLRATTIGVSGRLAAISRAASNVDQAIRFLGWASGPEQSARLCPRSPASAPFRKSHLAQPGMWVDESLSGGFATQYIQVVQQAMNHTAWFNAPRLPGQDRYLHALDEAVQSVLQDQASPTAALQLAATKWEQITEELGKDKQLKAYSHSLGIALD